jgi:DNA adenine methylase
MTPILKWLGGKTQIIDKLMIEFPQEINNYHEIFLGGGSVLLKLLEYIKSGKIKVNGNIYAYDLNESLIYVYKNIQNKHNELYIEIEKLIDNFNGIENKEGNESTKVNRNPINIDEAKKSKENYYYWIRNRYNKLNNEEKTTPLGSAMFIFLNKTCFRGIFRVGPNGFNVPYGHYKNPKIINKEHLIEMHNLIQNVIFNCCDYNMSLNNNKIKENDYIYLDPPYVPEKETSFVGYTINGFNKENHENLFELIHKLTNKSENIKIMMSNSDTELVYKNFKTEKYKIKTILCKRTINCKNPESKVSEVIIKNY